MSPHSTPTNACGCGRLGLHELSPGPRARPTRTPLPREEDSRPRLPPSAQTGSASLWSPLAPPYALQAALTHVELPHEAGHVVVLEVLGQHLFGKLALVEHVEAVPALQETCGRSRTPTPWGWATGPGRRGAHPLPGPPARYVARET